MGHVITTAGGSGPSKQVIRYLTERVVGNGSFGVVFQAKCIETGETVRAAVCRLPLQGLLPHAAAWCMPMRGAHWRLKDGAVGSRSAGAQ